MFQKEVYIMNRKLLYLIGISVVLIIILAVLLSINNNSINYNNETAKSELITKTYDEKTFSYIMKKVDSGENTIKINRFNIKPQCIRKTDCGGYAIYNLKSGKELYLFFNEEKKIIEYATVDKFISSDDILKYENGNANDILSLGRGVSITTSGTAKETLIYFLNDDKIGYVKFDNIIFTGDEKISNIEIGSNEEFLKSYKELNWQPYILPMDRYLER